MNGATEWKPRAHAKDNPAPSKVNAMKSELTKTGFIPLMTKRW
jgi:hypothetical protein